MKNKKFGFTLAEVLITLAIIGVVAALTIPTQLSNYRKHVIETKLVKFYSTVNQALEIAEADYGMREHWDPVRPGVPTKQEDGKYVEHTQSYWAKKYLIPYMQGIIRFKDETGEFLIFLKDGSSFGVSNYSFSYYPEGIKEDNDGNIISVPGKNKFNFYYNPVENEGMAKYSGRGIEPYKHNWDGNIETLKHGGYYACYDSSNPAYCTAVIQANGWKIPNDYPYHF